MNYKINLPIWLKPVTSNDLIRIGRKYDGGYLIQEQAIINRKILVSFGVNDDWSFENDFLQINPDSHIYLFDRSVSYIQIVKLLLKNIFHLPNIHPLFNSFKAFFGYHLFFNKKNVHFYPLYVGRNVLDESKSLIECFDLIKTPTNEMVVKIDIEGSEYRILSDLVIKKNSIDVLIIEFHDIDLHLESIRKFINDLSFSISHLHVNNYSNPDINGLPKDIEITLQRKIHFVDNCYYDYPLEIDMPSNRLKADLRINWF
jgi:hypothetical protein